jgi:hypothetical protein
MRRFAVLLAAFAVVLVARGEDGAAPPSQPRASLSVVSTSIRPAVHHFGEAVTAEIVILADKTLVDPTTVRVNPDFTPYEPVGSREVQRTETASSVKWRFRFRVRCLKEGCAPNGPRQTMELPGTAVVYRFRTSPGRSTAIVDWPSFEVSARVPDTALAPERWKADVTSLPAVTYDRSTTTLSLGLLAGSILFALLGGALLWWLVRPREPEPAAEIEEVEVRLTPLERALQLAREAALDGDSPERRKAFERVARELGARGFVELAERARALAWSSGPASAVAVDELERDTHAAVNGSTA